MVAFASDAEISDEPRPTAGLARPINKAVEQLRKDLADSRPFDTGTIIAWDSIGEKATYTYAAIYASGRWYTTIAQDNRYVQRTMTHDELLAFFAERGDHLANLRAATDFEAVSL